MENTLGKYLHNEREKRNMSLREFSELLGISHTYLNKLENNEESVIKNTTMNSIANALGKSVSYIFFNSK